MLSGIKTHCILCCKVFCGLTHTHTHRHLMTLLSPSCVICWRAFHLHRPGQSFPLAVIRGSGWAAENCCCSHRHWHMEFSPDSSHTTQRPTAVHLARSHTKQITVKISLMPHHHLYPTCTDESFTISPRMCIKTVNTVDFV